MLDVRDTDIPGVKLIALRKFEDARGFFSETYHARAWGDAGIGVRYVQDNHSYSADRNVLRGLHFQLPPMAQAKLVRVTRGAVFDVAVDLRRGSPSYGRHVGVQLSAEDWNALFVPVGFAHGFCTLESHTEVVYKVSDYYSPEHDRGLLWNDPELGIAWPVTPDSAILSERDQRHPRLAELPDIFP